MERERALSWAYQHRLDLTGPDDFHIVLASFGKQRGTVKETLPHLLSASLYADEVTVITTENDILLELMHDDLEHYHNNLRNIAHFGADISIENELSSMVEEGLIKKEHIENAHEVVDESGLTIAEIANARGVVRGFNRLLSHPNIYPLIHDPDNILSHTMVNIGNIATSEFVDDKFKTAEIGNSILQRLPEFSYANPEHVAEIKNQLSEYLIPFRAHLMELSKQSKHIPVGDWDSLEEVLHDIYLRKVLPAISELQKAHDNNRYIKVLLNDVMRDPAGTFGAVFSLGLGVLKYLPTSVSIPFAIASQMISSAQRMRVNHNLIKSNDLYFVHETGRQLKRTQDR